jgi:hypothetical protein
MLSQFYPSWFDYHNNTVTFLRVGVQAEESDASRVKSELLITLNTTSGHASHKTPYTLFDVGYKLSCVINKQKSV